MSAQLIRYSMDAENWFTPFSLNLRAHPTQEEDGISINILPEISEIDYLLVKHTEAITETSIEVTMEVIASEDVTFDSYTEAGNNPSNGISPSVRFVLFKEMNKEFKRWFSNPGALSLQPGIQTLNVNLTPDLWSSVYGKFGNLNAETLEGFSNILLSPNAIGLAFGGGNYFSHGIKVHNGSAKIKIKDFRLIS